MADEPNNEPDPNYEGDAPIHELTPEDHTMAAVDLALAPVLRSGEAGSVSYSQLQHAVRCIRTALAHAVYGAPPAAEITGESLDMLGVQRQAARDAAKADAIIAAEEKAKADADLQAKRAAALATDETVTDEPAKAYDSAYDKAKADAKAQAALVS